MDKILEAPSFVIHLDSCTDRKPFFMKNISEAGFQDIQIFKAVDGNDVIEKTSAMLKFGNLPIDSEMSGGGIGCMLSHFLVLQHIIDNGIELATIFEDDVWFHPNWKILCNEYYENTPNDWDVLFTGNGLDSCQLTSSTTPKITTESCWCTHAYTVTLKGAKTFLNMLLNWDYKNFNHTSRGKTLTGLYSIDIMIKDIQNNILIKRIPKTITWYCWNGTKYPYKSNLLPVTGNDRRNTGLVFQATDDFKSTISLNIPYTIGFFDEHLNKINTDTYETTEQWIAETFIPEDAIVLELGGRYGVVSCKINKRLKNKTNHLVVEPDPTVFSYMARNIVRNGAHCKMFNGIISKAPQYFQQAGIGSRTRCQPCSSESVLVEHRTLNEIIENFGLQFDTLVADCEGCLETFFDENLDYIKNFKLITFEEDYGNECNYEKIKKILADNNFKCIRPGGHSVWVKNLSSTSKPKKRFIWSL